MTEIHARNVNDALGVALTLLVSNHDVRQSRNGPVVAFREPVTTIYSRPTERVLFSMRRNANPVFHLMESLWMLAGQNDVKFLTQFVKRIAEYSDDGRVLHGAYGYRWRKWFLYDQLEAIAAEIRKDPSTRRAVLSMWDSGGALDVPSDLGTAFGGGKDVPCNTHAYFDARDGRLNMTVCCRSNDVLWGCYGANAVHFSILLEYMAAKCSLPVGVYRQMSNDLHLYTNVLDLHNMEAMAADVFACDQYRNGTIIPMPLIEEGETVEDFDSDLNQFFGLNNVLSQMDAQYETAFFNFTVAPMLRAWRARKNFDGAPRLAEKIASPDWSMSTKSWLLGMRK